MRHRAVQFDDAGATFAGNGVGFESLPVAEVAAQDPFIGQQADLFHELNQQVRQVGEVSCRVIGGIRRELTRQGGALLFDPGEAAFVFLQVMQLLDVTLLRPPIGRRPQEMRA